MTIAGYNMGGDLDICARETEKGTFMASAKKLAAQRAVSERTIMLWCYLRADSPQTAERIGNWISEEDSSQRWLMSLPQYEAQNDDHV